MSGFQALVLAAGKGTRMKSEKAKVLHEVLGLPLIGHVVDAALSAGAERVVVILGHQKDAVQTWLEGRYGENVVVVEQREQLGTGHAVWSALDSLIGGPDRTLILSGDVPNLRAETIRTFVDAARAYEFGLMTAELDDPARYGRILRDEEGSVVSIVEYKDATSDQRAIREINAGCYLISSTFLKVELDRLCAVAPSNAAGEYYLTDLVEIAARDVEVFGWSIPDFEEVGGVNTRSDLAAAEAFARKMRNRNWMDAGVTMIDPTTTYIETAVELGVDVVIHPGVMLRGNTRVAAGCVIETGSIIKDSTLDVDVHIKPYCVIHGATIGASSAVGPFAHLRPDSELGRECKVGNFVETKKTKLGDGAKASHLTYLGDAFVGAGANVGAGTITCNYDGKNKHITRIGAGAFIGSNSALVAPVSIGEGSYVGAGSVITTDIPDASLGVARGRQQNIEGWARRRRSQE